MATPRHLLVDPANECDYHLVSRCVRRAFLCGVDEHDGRDYSYRRAWLVQRLMRIAPCFAVDVYAYTVLSNHFHLVLRHDPLAGRGWSDDEVARRWVEAFPPTERGEVVEALKPERRELILDDPGRVARARATLGSMSHFMKHLKQPIARRANLEDDCTGHFFEQRFYSGALLTEEALIAAMAYVDLNPVRAELAKRIEEIRDTSIGERLQVNSAEALADYLRPVVSGLDGRAPPAGSPPVAVVAVESQVDGETVTFDLAAVGTGRPSEGEPQEAARGDPREVGTDAPVAESGAPAAESTEKSSGPEPGGPAEEPGRPRRRPPPHFTLAEYIDLVRAMAGADAGRSADRADGVSRWLARTTVLRRRQRAFGDGPALRRWLADRTMQFRETPLPA
ncbi:MAG: hypothetical protein OXH09_03035 [Gammaproteobacteria bacterium]|nr:hypothetical protein [Gammaproteobacteria bacterium]